MAAKKKVNWLLIGGGALAAFLLYRQFASSSSSTTTTTTTTTDTNTATTSPGLSSTATTASADATWTYYLSTLSTLNQQRLANASADDIAFIDNVITNNLWGQQSIEAQWNAFVSRYGLIF